MDSLANISVCYHCVDLTEIKMCWIREGLDGVVWIVLRSVRSSLKREPLTSRCRLWPWCSQDDHWTQRSIQSTETNERRARQWERTPCINQIYFVQHSWHMLCSIWPFDSGRDKIALPLWSGSIWTQSWGRSRRPAHRMGWGSRDQSVAQQVEWKDEDLRTVGLCLGVA